MGPFLMSFGYSYILVGVDYVSKWVEAILCKRNDHRVVLKFLKENISFWQVLMFLIAFLSLKQAKNEGEPDIIHGKARLKLNYMNNPSFGKLQSLFQINQVCKEENQRRNITLTNFATTCKIFARQKKISQPFFTNCEIFASPFSFVKISHHLSPLAKFSQPPFSLAKISHLLYSIAKISHLLFLLQNFCSSISDLQNLHVIFRYFAPTPLDFYLKIFCVIIYSLLVISWRSFKIFRISIWGAENISLYIS